MSLRNLAPVHHSLTAIALLILVTGSISCAPLSPPSTAAAGKSWIEASMRVMDSASASIYASEIQKARDFLASKSQAWGEPDRFIQDLDRLLLYYPTPGNEEDLLGPRGVIVLRSGEIRFDMRR